MLYALVAIVAAALAAVIALRWGAVAVRKEYPRMVPKGEFDVWSRTVDKDLYDLVARMGALEADHLDVRAAVAHGIEDVERVNNRISATIRRTKAQLDEHGLESPALDAEAAQLRVVDGGGGDDEPLPAVHEVVADVQSSIEGVSAAELAKVRGIYGHGV